MTEKENQITNANVVVEKKEINFYDKMLDLRKFEIENFWKRALFFWGTLALVLIAYSKNDLGHKYQPIISFIGLLYNIVFSLSLRGSKYWQEHWEVMATAYENKNNFSLVNEASYEPNFKSFFTYPYRFSVSKLTMLLSDSTVLMWFMLWLKDIISLALSKDQLKDHLFANLYVILFHVVILIYWAFFFSYGKVYHKRKKKEILKNN